MQDDDLAAQIGKSDHPPVGGAQREVRRRLVDRLEIFLIALQHRVDLVERVRLRVGSEAGCQQHKREQAS